MESTKSPESPCFNMEDIEEEITATFSPETAHNAYVPFTRLMGQFHMERILGDNHDIIWQLSTQYEHALSKHNVDPYGEVNVKLLQ